VSDLFLLDPVPLPDGLSIPAEDWQQTPMSVRHQFVSLLKRVNALEARLNQDSSNGSSPRPFFRILLSMVQTKIRRR
jgi:hypothetical protein